MGGKVRMPSPGTVLGALALMVSLGGVAVAAIPSGNGAFSACLSKDGELKVIDTEAGKGCQGSQTLVRLAGTDAAGKVANADTLDGVDSTGFLGAGAKAADADLLDGFDSTSFLTTSGKAADSDELDGLDSSAFQKDRGTPALLRIDDGDLQMVELGPFGSLAFACDSGHFILSVNGRFPQTLGAMALRLPDGSQEFSANLGTNGMSRFFPATDGGFLLQISNSGGAVASVVGNQIADGVNCLAFLDAEVR